MSLTEAVWAGNFLESSGFPVQQIGHGQIGIARRTNPGRERPACRSKEGTCVLAAWRISNAQHGVSFSLLKSSIRMTFPPLPFK